ncbi:hypothetical protein BDN72DRAFT_771337, partial [Pluteus cervinus]
MYHDKRFQTDLHFPFVAFSHQQIKAATSGSFLLAKKHQFEAISQRVVNLDTTALNHLIDRYAKEDIVHAQTDQERECFQILRDLDHINGHVKGSITSKKNMRNQIWSLVCAKGAPSWYITLSPTDVNHPISLYYADNQEVFKPTLKHYNEKIRLISANPVASARFFHLMVNLFITHVLGVNVHHMGVFGQTAAYFGTVEQ